MGEHSDAKVINAALLKQLIEKSGIPRKKVFDADAEARRRLGRPSISKRTLAAMTNEKQSSRHKIDLIRHLVTKFAIPGLTAEDMFQENGVTLEEVLGRRRPAPASGQAEPRSRLPTSRPDLDALFETTSGELDFAFDVFSAGSVFVTRREVSAMFLPLILFFDMHIQDPETKERIKGHLKAIMYELPATQPIHVDKAVESSVALHVRVVLEDALVLAEMYSEGRFDQCELFRIDFTEYNAGLDAKLSEIKATNSGTEFVDRRGGGEWRVSLIRPVASAPARPVAPDRVTSPHRGELPSVSSENVSTEPTEWNPNSAFSGFNWVQATTASALLLVMAAIAVPLIVNSRENARRAACTNNLKQIALATHNYESTVGSFPMGRNMQAYLDANGDVQGYKDGWSQLAALLDYTQKSELYNAINIGIGPYQPGNSTFSGIGLAHLWCPSDGTINALRTSTDAAGLDGKTVGITYSSYAGVMGTNTSDMKTAASLAGQNGMFPDGGAPKIADPNGFSQPPVKIAGVTDGTINTLLFGERAQGKMGRVGCGSGVGCDFEGRGWWSDDDFGNGTIATFYPINLGDAGLPRTKCDPSNPFTMAASSYHPGGANFAFADGSVHFLKDTIDTWDHKKIGFDADCIPVLRPPTVLQGVYQNLSTRAGGETISRGDY